MKNATVKILGINGSPRKNATYQALQLALEAAESVGGVSTELLSLHNMKFRGCNQCDSCVKHKSFCVHKDDFTPEVLEKFIRADAYIIAAPVYNMGIPGRLADFFNRMRPLHKIYPSDILQYKVGGAITVAGTRHGGQETALQVIHNFYFCRQIIVVGGERGAYSGGTVWSGDNLPEPGYVDEEGLATVKSLGIRVAKVAKTVRFGLEE